MASDLGATGTRTQIYSKAEVDAGFQPLDSDLTAVAALSPSNDDVVQRKAGAWTNRTIAQLLTDLAAAGTTFQPLDSDLTAIAALSTTSFGQSLLTLANAGAARTALSLVPGTDVEAHDTDLTTIAGLSPSNDDVLQRKAGAWANRTMAQLIADLAALGTTFQPLDSDLTAIAALSTTSFGQGLLALADAAAGRTAFGLGSLATASSLAHSATTGITATDHHAAPAAGPDADVTVDSAGAAGTASTFARSGHGHKLATSASSPAAIGTAAAGTSGHAPSRDDHVHATGAGTPSTQAFGDSASTGSGPAAAMTDHKHAMPALGTTPSTQAFADSAAGGSATTPSKNDHKHAMPTLGYGLSGNSAPAVGLSTASGLATAETTVSAASYADVTGASVSLAAGTWLLIGDVYGRSVNARAQMDVAITDGANTIVREGSSSIPASGTANVNDWGHVHVAAIVSPGSTTTYKLRAARGNTTLTNSWTAVDGSGQGVSNNASSNTDKGTGLIAVRIA